MVEGEHRGERRDGDARGDLRNEQWQP